MKVALSLYCAATLVAVFAVGCSTPQQNPRAHSSPTAVASPGMAAADTRPFESDLPPMQPGDRRIEPGDILTIEVLDELELTGERRVQASGIIIYAPLGVVPVAGQTTTQVAQYIADSLAPDYLLDPKVSVEIKEYRLQTVSVMGFVEKAGSVRLPSEYRIDILEAIAEAGGFSRTAHKGKIDLTRDGKTRTYSFEELRKVTDPARKVWLQPGDVIYVHESFI